MIKVLLCRERLNEHVIDVHFHGLAEIFGEHLVKEPLVRGSSVLEPEGHDFVAKDAPLRDEGGLLLVLWVHEYLVVA